MHSVTALRAAAALLGATAVAGLGTGCSSGGSGASSATGASRAAALTLAQYDQLHHGMSLAQTTAITGRCELTGDETAVITETLTYSCHGAGGQGQAKLTFDDGKLTTKAQTGLK